MDLEEALERILLYIMKNDVKSMDFEQLAKAANLDEPIYDEFDYMLALNTIQEDIQKTLESLDWIALNRLLNEIEDIERG